MAAFSPCQTSRQLNGKLTQVLLQTFADRVLVLVTQMGKIGNLIQATLPSSSFVTPPTSQLENSLLPEPSPSIELTPLFGSAPSPDLHTLHALYASHIATIVWTEESKMGLEGFRRSVVVGLALVKSDDESESSRRQNQREVFEGVMKMVYDLLKFR